MRGSSQGFRAPGRRELSTVTAAPDLFHVSNCTQLYQCCNSELDISGYILFVNSSVESLYTPGYIRCYGAKRGTVRLWRDPSRVAGSQGTDSDATRRFG